MDAEFSLVKVSFKNSYVKTVIVETLFIPVG